jgi:hypothetical protein
VTGMNNKKPETSPLRPQIKQLNDNEQDKALGKKKQSAILKFIFY